VQQRGLVGKQPDTTAIMTNSAILPSNRIRSKIIHLRGENVLIDQDIAMLYSVETRILVRNVKRNIDRFPNDFMFQLSSAEFEELKSHFGTSASWGGRRYPPYAFTEQGVAMLSSVLHSKAAIQVNIQIMRAFVELRQLLLSHDLLSTKLAELEHKLTEHDDHFRTVFDAIRQLMLPPRGHDRRRIGFRRRDND